MCATSLSGSPYRGGRFTAGEGCAIFGDSLHTVLGRPARPRTFGRQSLCPPSLSWVGLHYILFRWYAFVCANTVLASARTPALIVISNRVWCTLLFSQYVCSDRRTCSCRFSLGCGTRKPWIVSGPSSREKKCRRLATTAMTTLKCWSTSASRWAGSRRAWECVALLSAAAPFNTLPKERTCRVLSCILSTKCCLIWPTTHFLPPKQVKWRGENWYTGTIKDYNPDTHLWRMEYDDGDERSYVMSTKTWRFVKEQRRR